MNYRYKVSGKGLDENYKAVDWKHEGQCNGDHPFRDLDNLWYNEETQNGFAVLNAVADCIDVLDHCKGSLYPHLDITNNLDGTIDAVVDTHGFGDIAVHLIQLPEKA